MTFDQIETAVTFMLIACVWLTMFALRKAVKRGDDWRDAWMRDSAELLYWKRHATLRDPKTGRYVKKVKRNG